MLFYRQLGPIRAMSFDLDDTLYDNHPVIERLEQQVTQWLHQQHPLTASQPNAWWVSLKRQIAVQDPWLRHDVTQWRFE
ncbi:2-haloalkanoic acid dehalogenase, partial [Vibrio parahaemolyticus]|nr:2-haloalkanoic acid dehalogenase [Vibrio parahaemolyticus]